MEPESSLTCSQATATAPILSDMNPVHTLPPYLPKIHSNIILSSTPRFCEWFSDKNFVRVSHLFLGC
jgi:hypothetical protein